MIQSTVSRVKAWFLALPRRKQDGLSATIILAGLFVLTSPPIAPYFWLVFWGANILFWIGIALYIVVGLVLAALTTRL